MSVSIDVFNSENKYKCEKIVDQKTILKYIFATVHISINFVLKNLKSLFYAVRDIHIEGVVSQNGV